LPADGLLFGGRYGDGAFAYGPRIALSCGGRTFWPCALRFFWPGAFSSPRAAQPFSPVDEWAFVPRARRSSLPSAEPAYARVARPFGCAELAYDVLSFAPVYGAPKHALFCALQIAVRGACLPFEPCAEALHSSSSSW
jgi:hypothetical protein